MRLRSAFLAACSVSCIGQLTTTQVSAQAQGTNLPFCRASTCIDAQQNCIDARVRRNLSVAELQCERFGASCRRTLVFPGNPYSPFPQGCRVKGT
jgi:hypothetical protein